MDRPIDVRFIEYMPFDGNVGAEEARVTFKEAIGRLREAYPGLQPIVTDKHDVATSWKLPGAQGQVSFVSSMTAPFCGGCNLRLRPHRRRQHQDVPLRQRRALVARRSPRGGDRARAATARMGRATGQARAPRR